MARAQYKAISVEPLRIFGVVAKVLGPKCKGHGRAAHRHARVATFRVLNRVHSQATNDIDTPCLKIV